MVRVELTKTTIDKARLNCQLYIESKYDTVPAVCESKKHDPALDCIYSLLISIESIFS